MTHRSMTCRVARRQMAELFDGGDLSGHPELREHLAGCGDCAAEFEEAVNAVARLAPGQRVCASPGFQERTMRKLAAELNAVQTVRPRRPMAPFWRLAILAAAILAVVSVLPHLGVLGTNRGAVALLAQSVQALDRVRSVHIVARMRAPAGDNFETIGTEFAFEPIEMWKDFGPPARWRVENPGRVVVMDGKRSTMFMKPDMAIRGGRDAGFIEWMRPLLDPERVLEAELRAARKGESHAEIRREGAGVTLTSWRKAEGEFANDWLRNSSIPESDHARVYRFDAATGRLTGLQVMVRDAGRDVLVFEIAEIRYNEPLAPELFTLELPAGVSWKVSPEEMPVNGALPATPRDAAAAFFEGLAQRDWDRVLTVYAVSTVPESLRRDYGGLRVVSLGEPFQSGIYGGWFVPYELTLADGSSKKWNLSVRNDNPAHRWVVDGGY